MGDLYILIRSLLTLLRKNNRGIYDVDHNMTAVADILILGLQLY